MNGARPFVPDKLGAGLHWHHWDHGTRVQLRGRKCVRKTMKVYAKTGETWALLEDPPEAPDGECDLAKSE